MPILNWLTRDEDIRTAQRVPYRLLEEVPDLSAGDGGAGNMMIQGDNLEALKALLPFYAGRVKTILGAHSIGIARDAWVERGVRPGRCYGSSASPRATRRCESL